MKGCDKLKKLICAKEVELSGKQGQKIIYIDTDTLITPSAKDAAASYGIVFSTDRPPCGCEAPRTDGQQSCCKTSQKESIDSELIYQALKKLLEKGMLGNLMSAVEMPYLSEKDPEGMVKLVRGSTAKWKPLDTGNPSNKVFYNEVISASDGSSMNAGFMTIEKCDFPWDVACQEIYYVVEGTLTVKKDEQLFTARPGDVLFFRKGAKLTFGSPDKVKVFYATY